MSCSSGSGRDLIRIPRLRARCILGVHPHERVRRRVVEVSVDVEADLEAAAASDSLQPAVDYSEVARRVRAAVESSAFRLLEALARSVAAAVLALPAVRAVVVSVRKPGALRGAGAPEVVMRRERP